MVAIYEHLVFTGVHNADETGSKGPAGDVRAWDLRTGEFVWTFHSVPRPGEPIPAVGVMTKYPVLFIFNRVTGEPIYEIEEQPLLVH